MAYANANNNYAKQFQEIQSRINGLESDVVILHEALSSTREFTENSYADYVNYRQEKRQYEDREKRLKHIRYLSGLKKEIKGKCLCGNHVGINFVESDGSVVEEKMCPKTWWVHQSWLAFTEGRLKEFTETTPIEKYLNFKGAKNG